MDKELLVVRSKVFIKPKHFQDLIENLQYQRATGVVLLPPYLEAMVVPSDIEIKVERLEEKKNDQT